MKSAVFVLILMINTMIQVGQANEVVGENCAEKTKTRDLKLEMVIELSRHGERASKANFPNIVNGKSFAVAPKELTKKGAQSHYAIGKALRKEFEKEGLLDTTKYNPLDLYVQSTQKQRTMSSANAQLEGLFDKDLTWPPKNSTMFHINYSTLKEDGMMSMLPETCQRLTEAGKAIRDDEQTKAMFARHREFLEPLIYDTLRSSAGMKNATLNELNDLANFIDWTKRDGRNVNFNLTAKDLALIETIIETNVYSDLGAVPEQTFLPVWELLQSVSELSKTMSKRMAFQDMEVFHKYAKLRKKLPVKKLPKFVLFSGHAEQVHPMLQALQTPLGVMPQAASRVYFNFYNCTSCEHGRHHWVKPVYAPFSHDNSVQLPLIVSDKQEKDGLMLAKDFEDFIDEALAKAAVDMGLRTTNYAEICKSTYEKHLDYLDPEEHRQSIYKLFLSEYDILPTTPIISSQND